MSAGYIQLAAIGQQDAYLTGSPQLTYFIGVYRRHTPFVLEAYDIPFQDQQVLYGTNNICKIPPKGDLIRGLTLNIGLPALKDPGTFYTWPENPTTSNVAHILIGPTGGGAPIYKYDNSSVGYYSTQNQGSWGGSFTPYTYLQNTNQFQFSNCSNVEVEPSWCLFWGLDPKNATGTRANGNLYYNVSTSRFSDFTFELAGWARSTGLPDTDTRTGIFLTSIQTLPFTGTSYINFSQSNLNGVYWRNQDSSTVYTVTANGRIMFARTGYYMVRAAFNVSAGGSVQTLSYGFDGSDVGAPVAPVFAGSYDYRVSTDSSMPAIIPLLVDNTSNSYYFYATTTGTSFGVGSYVSINTVEEIYKLSGPITLSSQNSQVLLYGNVDSSYVQGNYLTLNSDSTMSFIKKGQYNLDGYVHLNGSNITSNVSLWEGSNLVYLYDMTLHGQNPTWSFAMPMSITDLARKYYIKIGNNTSGATLISNTFFIVQQTGVDAADPAGSILSYEGTQFRPITSTFTPNSRLNLNNFTSYGNSAYITLTSTGNIVFTAQATYMMTAVICTDDQISSVTFGSTTYPVGLGLLPPYTVSVPYSPTSLSANVEISFQTNGSSPNLYSNTFISVYPVSSNLSVSSSYNYYDSVGTWAIKTAELKIGGQSIQTLTGEYIEMWNDLYVPYENQAGLTLLTGKYDTQTQVYPPGRNYYVNLPFYFYGHPELYLPLVALDRQDVEVHVTFRRFNELTSITTVDNQTLTATIITEYVYLSTPEINWFQRSRIDYVITQNQYQNIDLLQNFTSAIFELKFLNPVRELFFIIQPVDNLTFDYSNNGLKNLGLSFNGEDIFSSKTTDALYLGSLEPFNHYPNFPTRQFYMYAFTTAPGSSKPFGHVNFSRIKQALLTVNVEGSYLPAKQLRVIASSYNVLRVENGLAGLMFNV
jgi:hypothetical protein